MLSECSHQVIAAALDELIAAGKTALGKEGIDTARLELIPSLDLCYQGQAYTLNIPRININDTESRFHQQHQALFGHRLDTPVELVNIRAGPLIVMDEVSTIYIAPGRACMADIYANLILEK